MVSSYLGMPIDELIAKLKGFAVEYVDDPQYKELRANLPANFPF